MADAIIFKDYEVRPRYYQQGDRSGCKPHFVRLSLDAGPSSHCPPAWCSKPTAPLLTFHLLTLTLSASGNLGSYKMSIL